MTDRTLPDTPLDPVEASDAVPGAPREGASEPLSVAVPAPEATLTTADRGSLRTFEIALDEAVLRGADGMDRTIRIDPPATLETLPARLRALAPESEVLPVCYEPGKPHTFPYRRIITGDITLELPSPDADRALPQGVVLKSRPDYAPGFVIVSAADPFAVIAALEPLRRQPGIVSADIQLAKQQSKKAMPNDPLVANQWHLKNTSTDRTHVNIENMSIPPMTRTGTTTTTPRIPLLRPLLIRTMEITTAPPAPEMPPPAGTTASG